MNQANELLLFEFDCFNVQNMYSMVFFWGQILDLTCLAYKLCGWT